MSKEKIIVGIAGSGAMGSGIAQIAAANGHAVILYDNNEAALQKSKLDLSHRLSILIEKQKINREVADRVLERTTYSSSLMSFSKCGIIIEAIVEKIEIKQQLFREIEMIVAKECILASNTSSISITSIAGKCTNPSRLIGIHFFNPAPIMPLVEIIPGLVTDESITAFAKALIDSWGKVTVIAKDTPGFIVNRIARPFYSEAIKVYEEQIADFSTIDLAMKEIGGFRMGPFELMDFIGNDVNYAVTETVWQQMFYDPRYKPSLTQKRLNEAQWLGKKSGKGYYDYSTGAVQADADKDSDKLKYIFNRILCMLINEAIDAMYLGIASKDDIDLAMTKGVNYPKGLLKWADEVGCNHVLNTIDNLKLEYAEDRYRPSVLLRKMANQNRKFYND